MFRAVGFCLLLVVVSCADPDFKTNHPEDPLTPLGALMWSTTFCGYDVKAGTPNVDGSASDFPASSVLVTDLQGDASGTNDILSLSALQNGSMLYIYVAMNGTPTTGTLTFTGGRISRSIRFSGSGAVTDSCTTQGADIGVSYTSGGAEFYVRPGTCLPDLGGHGRLFASVPQGLAGDSAQTCDIRWGF